MVLRIRRRRRIKMRMKRMVMIRRRNKRIVMKMRMLRMRMRIRMMRMEVLMRMSMTIDAIMMIKTAVIVAEILIRIIISDMSICVNNCNKTNNVIIIDKDNDDVDDLKTHISLFPNGSVRIIE